MVRSCILALALSLYARVAALSVTRLAVELLPAPPVAARVSPSLLYALDAPLPRFSWVLLDAATAQASYRIVAPGLWDSGVVPSNATSQVEWGGPPLPSDSDVPFTLTTTTVDGASASADGSFATGLAPADWRRAAWIGGGGALRGSLTLPAAPVTRAVAHVTGVGMYELCINGVRVNKLADGRVSHLNPGFSTVYTSRVLYNSWDVAPLLKEGVNAVGVRLGEGKYGYLGEFCTGGPLACNKGILSLTVHLADGSNATLLSGGSWLAGPTPLALIPLQYPLYNGERVDARVGDAAWCSSDYVPSAQWVPATVRPSPTKVLSAHTFPPIASWAPSRTAVTVSPIAGIAQAFVFAFATNGAYVCSLRLPAGVPAGVVVTLKYGEQVGAEGVIVGFACPSACCADGGNCANQTFAYTTSGSGNEVFEMSFANAAFKFAELRGWPASGTPSADVLACEPTSTAVAEAGSVRFNDTVLDGVQGLILRSQRANWHSIPTDCPHRERRGWMADAGVSVTEAMLNLDLAKPYENWLRTHADTQATGCISPLPVNCTCPKWHDNQPFTEEEVVLTASGNADEGDNCYLCCDARPGFGCSPETPKGDGGGGGVSDVLPFDKNGCA